MNNFLSRFPSWFREIPHLFIAICLFITLLIVWIPTRDHDLWSLVNTAFGAVMALLTRALSSSPETTVTTTAKDDSIRTSIKSESKEASKG